jgi:hypothetical protein
MLRGSANRETDMGPSLSFSRNHPITTRVGGLLARLEITDLIAARSAAQRGNRSGDLFYGGAAVGVEDAADGVVQLDR